MTLNGRQTDREPDNDFYVACNAWSEMTPFRIPEAPSGRPWRRVVDTALTPPRDIDASGDGPQVPAGSAYPMAPFSMLVLMSEL